MGIVVVLFDLNNVGGGAELTRPIVQRASAFRGNVLAPVKSAKRLSHPWPFQVKNNQDRHSPDYGGASQGGSSFVT